MPNSNVENTPHCQATTQQGKPCGGYPLAGSQYCFTHSPAHDQERADARQRGGENHPAHINPNPFPNTDVTSARGLKRFVAALIQDAWTLPPSVDRVRALANLVTIQQGLLEPAEREQIHEDLQNKKDLQNNKDLQNKKELENNKDLENDEGQERRVQAQIPADPPPPRKQAETRNLTSDNASDTNESETAEPAAPHESGKIPAPQALWDNAPQASARETIPNQAPEISYDPWTYITNQQKKPASILPVWEAY